MKMRVLGQSGVHVSELCLGAMMFGKFGNQDVDECIRIVHRSLDEGINFIDTADVYSRGESEEILAKALKGRRDDVVLATKFYNAMDRSPNHRGSSRRWIMKACEDSLRRLGTDYIDLYQAHRPDHDTDIDETLGALTDLVAQGKVRMVGTSTFPAEALVEAHWTSERRGFVKFRCEQPPYSIFVRGIERDVLPTCQKYGMGTIVWSPLNGGWLTGKYRKGEQAPADSRFARFGGLGSWTTDGSGAQAKLELLDELYKIAADAGLTLIQLALGFTLAHPGVTSAIIGPRTMEQLDSQLPAADLELDPAILDRIDELVPPGSTVDRGDYFYESPAIARTELRRRTWS